MRVVNAANADTSASRQPGGVPPKVVPLQYGRANPAGDAFRRARAGVHERFHGAAEFVGLVVCILGGPQRAALAFGLGFALGGFAYGLAASDRSGTSAFFAAVGGFLIGWAVPLPPPNPSL